MMAKLLKKMAVDVPALNENTVVPLRVSNTCVYHLLNADPRLTVLVGFRNGFELNCTIKTKIN